MNHTKLLTTVMILCCLFSCKEEAAPQPKARPALKEKPQEATAARRDSIVAFAEKYMGTPYCYASADPVKGFDCSGFVHFVFAHFGIEVPRSSSEFGKLGPALKPADFKKGDVLVFYGYRDRTAVGHVGIVYEANGMQSTFIHASSGSEYAVTISDLASEQYTGRLYKCVDVVGEENCYYR